MMIKPTIALQPTPATPRWVFGTRLSETLFVAPMSAKMLPFHPAFGNGDTPHYGL
jgi:hypothetical protein